MRRIAAIFALSLTLGCASTTVIRTNPPGASIRSIENGYSGVTPFTYGDSNIVGTSRTFVIEAPGYQTETLVIKRDQWDTGRLVLSVIGGIILFVPYVGIFWSADYAPFYDVTLRPASDLPPPATDTVPPL